MKIGYLLDSYPYQRNIINIVENSEYVKVFDFNRITAKVLRKLKMNAVDAEYTYRSITSENVDLLHFFNSVSYGKTPWVSTFETVIPRYKSLMSGLEGLPYDKDVDKALGAVESDKCRKIIAISECTANFQRELLKLYPKHMGIEKKMCVMHPPQKLFVNDYSEKGIEDTSVIKFMFIGRDFFRKGGAEILEAFKTLCKDYPLKLTIVSTLDYNDYATKSTSEDYNKALDIIEKNDWISYHKNVSNEKVLELIKEHHVGLLPTWADTYGFSVLEMQACGCPVITTDVRALPEINNNQCGWVINVPKNKLGEAFYRTEADRDVMKKTIISGLMKVVSEIFKDTASIKVKSNNSIMRIKEEHSLEKFGLRMKEIYGIK